MDTCKALTQFPGGNFDVDCGESVVLHEASTGLHRLRWSRWKIPELKQDPAAFAAGCVLPASATLQPPEHSRNTNPNPLTQLGAKAGG